MMRNEPRQTAWHRLRVPGLPISARLDRRAPLVIAVLLTIMVVALVISVSYGEFTLSPLDVVRATLGLPTEAENAPLVVRVLRLPRILAGVLVGIALALSGTMLQGVTRNDLASPDILGISAGAGLVAVWLITTVSSASAMILPWAALAGGLGTALLIYAFAWQAGSAPIRLVLVGIGLGSIASALTSYLLITSEINQAQQAMIWLAGSLYARDWSHVRTLTLWLAILGPATLLLARPLNALALGDDLAVGVGMRLEVTRGLLTLVSVALAAVAVAMSGTIGFVGFVAPHMARRLVGPGHEGLLPTAALLGGLLIVVADLVARWIIAPAELPVGVVTAVLGAPYFFYLLYRRGGNAIKK